MSDVEKRRLKLLQETRKLYSDTYAPPAIHPRFNATYRSIYEDHGEVQHSNYGFLIRTVVAILIFSLCFVMKYENQTIGTVDCNQVIAVLQDDLFGK